MKKTQTVNPLLNDYMMKNSSNHVTYYFSNERNRDTLITHIMYEYGYSIGVTRDEVSHAIDLMFYSQGISLSKPK